MIRKGLPTYLLAQASIIALVGQRIRPGKLPQSDSANGAIIFSRLPSEGAHLPNIDLISGADQPRMELVFLSDTYEGAHNIAEAVRNKLSGYDGLMGTVEVTSCVLVDDYDKYFQNQDGSDSGLFAIVHEYDIQYRETIPAL